MLYVGALSYSRGFESLGLQSARTEKATERLETTNKTSKTRVADQGAINRQFPNPYSLVLILFYASYSWFVYDICTYYIFYSNVTKCCSRRINYRTLEVDVTVAVLLASIFDWTKNIFKFQLKYTTAVIVESNKYSKINVNNYYLIYQVLILISRQLRAD